jgi:hypothetical protein
MHQIYPVKYIDTTVPSKELPLKSLHRQKHLESHTFSVIEMTVKLARLNYIITVATLANLAFVTLSVWFFPKVFIFQITSSLAWTLIALQWIIANKLKRWHIQNLK